MKNNSKTTRFPWALFAVVSAIMLFLVFGDNMYYSYLGILFGIFFFILIILLYVIFVYRAENKHYAQLHAADAEMKKSLDEINDLYNNAPCGYHSLDANGICLRINDTELSWLGYSRDEVIGKSYFHEILSGESQNNFKKGFAAFMNDGELKGRELQLKRKDGTVFPVLMNSSIVKYLSGAFIMTRSTIFDITERNKYENNLRDSEEMFRVLFNSSSDALMTLEPPLWNFTTCNPATLKMFVCKDEMEFCSFPLWKLSPEFQPDGSLSSDKAKEMIEIAMLEGANLFYWTHKRTTGENFPAIVMLTKVNISGKEFLQATVRDITGQNKAEQENRIMQKQLLQTSKLTALGEMASGIAHELNNPLTIIMGNAQYIKDMKGTSGQFAQIFSEIDEASQRCKKIVGNLLEFSKMNETDMLECSVNAILLNAIRLVSYQPEVKQIKIVNDLSPEMPQVLGNMSRLEQVFINMIINAAHAMQNGGTLHISTRFDSINNRDEILFKDEGYGISPENIDKIFDPFFTTKEKGTGLGLSISCGIIHQHHGNITVESEGKDKGTTFSIYLPAA
ncbi:MAG: ATP-binding protein [Elusimicrobiota bacterium]